jgi:hypothetical protein
MPINYSDKRLSTCCCPRKLISFLQEIHFLHERSSKLAWFSTMQSIGTAAFVISTSYLVADLGWRSRYGVFSIARGVVLISSFLLIPESLCHRPTDAFEGTLHVHHKQGGPDTAVQATVKHRVELDFVRFKARTFKDDIRIFHGKPNWNAAADCYCQMAQCILFPNILWVVLMNSAVLGIYVVMVTEFGGIFVAPPYNFPFTSLGFIQGGQIIVSILLVSILGWGGDHLTRVMAKGNNGLSEPEYRLIPILLPAVIVVTRCVRLAPYRLVTLGHHHHLQRRILWFYRYCIDRVHLFPQLLR